MMNNDRLNNILRCIVKYYIDHAAPVGSGLIAKIYQEGISSASVRNVMGELERLGLITHPHTSAGRIPTVEGYRYYVRYLIHEDFEEPEVLDSNQVEASIRVDRHLFRYAQDIEEVARALSTQLANESLNAGLCFVKNIRRVSYFKDIDYRGHAVVSDQGQIDRRLFIDGARYFMRQPEFLNQEFAYYLIKSFEQKEHLMSFLDGVEDSEQVQVLIGDELSCGEFDNTSMIVKSYSLNGQALGCLGIVGPTRMNYSKNIRLVDSMSEALTGFLNRL